MPDFERIVCNVCGGNIKFTEDGKNGICKYCGSEFHFKEAKGPALALALNNAAGYLNRNDFDNAIVHYESILKEHPTDAEAAWGHTISTYGIVYAKDDRTNRIIPTCSRIVKESILDNASYRLAISECADEQRPIYEENAAYIDKVQKRIKRAMEDEEDFDVFISFKATDENGIATEDSVIARNIYDELEKRGIKTFFSEVTLRNRFGDEYEPIIYRALYSCKFFILVATKEEYIEAPWVKNEWTRFRDRLVDEGLAGACSAVLKGVSPYSVPRAFQTQGIDLEKHPFDYAQLVADNLSVKLGVNDNKGESNSTTAMSQEVFAEMLRQFEENKKREEEEARRKAESEEKTKQKAQEARLKAEAEEKARRMAETRKKINKKIPIISIALVAVVISVLLGCFVVYPLIEQNNVYPSIEQPNDTEVNKYGENVDVVQNNENKYSQGLEFISNGDGTCYVSGMGECIDTYVVIPSASPAGDKVTGIGDGAFYNCWSLTGIEIPASVTSISVSAFYNTSYYDDENNWEDSVLYIGNHLIKAKHTISGEYTIKSGTITIADSAFQGCSSLTGVDIPDGVSLIGSSTFSDCSSLASVTIPAGVTSIGNRAFNECPKLTSVTFAEGSQLAFIGHEAFNLCTSLKSVTFAEGGQLSSIVERLFSGCSSLTNIDNIPASVTSIGDLAFYNCTSLKSVTFAEGSQLTSIGYEAFYYCTSLTSIEIPVSVISIGEYAFYHCESLTSIVIPAGVTSIGNSAFADCTSLTSIEIPASVTSIATCAFSDCKSLTDVYYTGTKEEWSAINISEGNYKLKNATIHYNS